MNKKQQIKRLIYDWLFNSKKRKTINVPWNDDYIDDVANMVIDINALIKKEEVEMAEQERKIDETEVPEKFLSNNKEDVIVHNVSELMEQLKLLPGDMLIETVFSLGTKMVVYNIEKGEYALEFMMKEDKPKDKKRTIIRRIG